MIVKMEKTHFTFTDRPIDKLTFIGMDLMKNGKRKGGGGLANHLYYLVADKKTGLYSKERCNLEIKLNPMLADLGEKLELIGESLTVKELKNICIEEAKSQQSHFVQYVKNSRKSIDLDENGECFDKNKLFNYKCNFDFQQHEYQKILDHFKGDKEQTKLKMKEIQNEFFCILYNDIKKAQGIEGRLTKRSDIEVLSNWHIEGEANPHIHSYLHAFDPVSKRFMNARDFGLAKQRAHFKLEKKYKQFIDQGISLGYDKIDGIQGRRNYLSEWIPKIGMRKTLDKYYKIQNEIGQILSNPKLSTDEMKAQLEETGLKIDVKVSGEKKVSNIHIRLNDSSAILTKHSFMNKEVRSKLGSFAERMTHDRKLTPNNKTNKMEEVIQEQYTTTIKILEKQLKLVPEEQKTIIKLNAFYNFAERCRKSGVYVDINKQGNCSYIKMGVNNFKSDKNISLTKFKSSLMISNELQGKNIKNVFDLDVEDIENYRLDHLNHIPNSLNYGKTTAYIRGNFDDINLVDYEHFILKMSRGFLTKKNITITEKDNCIYLTDGKNRPLIKIENIDKDKQLITTSNLYPNEAATLLHNLLIEDTKNLTEVDDVIVIKPTNGSTKYDNLRHLQLKILFSTDKNSKKIVVKYPNMKNDEKLIQMIEVEFNKRMNEIDKQFDINTKKIKKGVFNFTDKAGLTMLDNPNMENHHNEVRSKLNDQIIQLITKENVKDIRFNKQSSDEYMLANKAEIFDKAENLPPEEKAKLIAHYEEIEKENNKPKQVYSNSKKNNLKKGGDRKIK